MTTPNLSLPLLAAAQAQKHVTVNEALSRLDGLVQLSVISASLAAPPASPAEGDRCIVAAGATGAWAGWDESVALFSGGAWLRLIPQTGWSAHDVAMSQQLVFDGLAWAAAASGGGASVSAAGSQVLATPSDINFAGAGVSVTDDLDGTVTVTVPGGGGGGGAPVTYNPFLKKVDIPLASGFATVSDTTGAAGTITDDAALGLTLASTSGSETGRLIRTKPVPANWERIEFAMVSDQSAVAYSSNGLTLVGPTGKFVTIGVGTNSAKAPKARALYWNANGTNAGTIRDNVGFSGWAGYFRVQKIGTTLRATWSHDGFDWAWLADIAETTHLGGAAVTVGPCANYNTTLRVPYYADADIVPQFAGFVGAGGSAPVLADMTLAQSPSGAAIGSHVVEELLSGLTGASVTSTIAIPDRAIVLGVSTRTVTAITGATSFDCGIAGTPSKFGGMLGIGAGSTNVGVIGPQAFYTATPIVLTANGGNFTGGDVRIAIQYLLPTAPAA